MVGHLHINLKSSLHFTAWRCCFILRCLKTNISFFEELLFWGTYSIWFVVKSSLTLFFCPLCFFFFHCLPPKKLTRDCLKEKCRNRIISSSGIIWFWREMGLPTNRREQMGQSLLAPSLNDTFKPSLSHQRRNPVSLFLSPICYISPTTSLWCSTVQCKG